MRHGKKQESVTNTQEKKSKQQVASYKVQCQTQHAKTSQGSLQIMFKEPKEILYMEVKEGMMTVSHPIDNIDRDRHYKEEHYEVEKYKN